MKRQTKTNQPADCPTNDICLGLVLTAVFAKRDEAIAQVKDHGAVQLGEPQGNRLPGCLIAPRGMDRDLISEIEALPAIDRVEIAFAQVIEEEEV